MYNRVGKKIKGLVGVVIKILIALNIFLSVITLFWGAGSEEPIICLCGLLSAILGSFLIWVSGLTLYAFGEITDCVQKLAGNLPEVTEELQMEENPGTPNFWVCKACGTKNPLVRTTCSKCMMSCEWYDVED